MDTINKEHACAFTGHRPERLSIPDSKVIAWLDKEIRKAVEAGYTQFISGMQRGVDLWAAEAVLKLRKEGKPIRLIAASAFRGMEDQWDRSWQTRISSATGRAGRRSSGETAGWRITLPG